MKKILKTLANYFDLQSGVREKDITNKVEVFEGVIDASLESGECMIRPSGAQVVWDQFWSNLGQQAPLKNVPEKYGLMYIISHDKELKLDRAIKMGRSDTNLNLSYRKKLPQGKAHYLTILYPYTDNLKIDRNIGDKKEMIMSFKK